MSDRIKKIKIKQTDGTFSDYIPIGANAKDIDLQYNDSNVENTLKKKPYYYDNVATMKLDDTLREGDMAITLGYYEANDGGGAEYIIKNITQQLSFDNINMIELSTVNYYAELIRNNHNIFSENELTSTRIGRIFNYINNTEVEYRRAQGFCHIDSQKFAIAFIKFENPDNTVNLQIRSYETGNVLQEVTYQGGHGNGMCYVASLNKIFVADDYYVDDEGEITNETNTFHVFDLNNLSNYQKITLNTEIIGLTMSYDNITNKLYFIGHTNWQRDVMKILELNQTDYSINSTITFNINETDRQDAKIYNDFLYFLTINPNRLIILDLNGNILQRYNIPEFIDNTFPIGEAEGFSIDTETNNIIMASYLIYNLDVACSTEIFKLNLQKNVSNNNFEKYYAGNQIELIIDNTIEDFLPPKNKFKELCEVQGILNSPSFNNCIANINCTSNQDYILATFADCMFTLNCNSSKICLNLRGVKSIINNPTWKIGKDGDNNDYSSQIQRNSWVENNSGSIDDYAVDIPFIVITNSKFVTVGNMMTNMLNKKVFQINTGGDLKSQYNIINIIFNSPNHFVDQYQISKIDSVFDTVDSNITLNDFMTYNNIKLSNLITKFKYLVVNCSTSSGSQKTFKFRINNSVETQYFSINDLNNKDSSPYEYIMSECSFTFNKTTEEFKIITNRRINQDGTTSEPSQININAIILTNNI